MGYVCFLRFLFDLVRHNDLAVLLFKFCDTTADEVEDLAVAASSLVFGDIVELVMEL